MTSTELESNSFTKALMDADSQSTSKVYRAPLLIPSFYTQDHDGNTQLHRYMIDSPDHNFTKHFIDVTWPPSFLDIRNTDGQTVLHLGAMRNQSDIVRQLLVAGANPMSKDYLGCIPLHYACEKGNIDIVTALTKPFSKEEKSRMTLRNLETPDLSPSLHERNNEGEAPLHVATEYGYLDIVKLFLKLGANLNLVRFIDGRQPLRIAIMKGHQEIADTIVNYHEENPNDQWQKMGFGKKLIEICKIPFNRLYSQISSGSE